MGEHGQCVCVSVCVCEAVYVCVCDCICSVRPLMERDLDISHSLPLWTVLVVGAGNTNGSSFDRILVCIIEEFIAHHLFGPSIFSLSKQFFQQTLEHDDFQLEKDREFSKLHFIIMRWHQSIGYTIWKPINCAQNFVTLKAFALTYDKFYFLTGYNTTIQRASLELQLFES